MSLISIFLSDLNRESETTRKMLSRIPNDSFDWKPHPKSMSIRQLAGHIAELPTWIPMVLTTNELDFAANPYTQPEISNTADVMALFEKSPIDGRSELKESNESILSELWTLRDGDQVYSVEPKSDVIRMTLNQIVHHRAQLGVFLRLLDIPIPGSYGPSADEMSFAAA